MVTIEIPPRIVIRSAITMNVYGRSSASLTIHMTFSTLSNWRTAARLPQSRHAAMG
jgi:hypothetical protein